MRTWTLAELQAFLRFTSDDEYHVGYVLAACCGMRRGEVCGLRWSDVDLDGGVPSDRTCGCGRRSSRWTTS
jgi:integrase